MNINLKHFVNRFMLIYFRQLKPISSSVFDPFNERHKGFDGAV